MTGPFLAPARALSNPMLTSSFVVLRRREVVTSEGVSTVPTPVPYPAIGVVTSAGPNDLRRLEEYDAADRHIAIVTRFRLQMTSPGFKPDIVVWNGDNFVVKAIDPYPQYGDGWVQAIVGSIDLQDQPVPERQTMPGQFDFQRPGNSPWMEAA